MPADRRVPGVAVRTLGRTSVAALVAFHAWLLGLHLVERQTFQPGTAVRWAVAVLVILGFRALSRRGLPLFSGRRAVGLWLLVVLVHCSAAWDGGAARLDPGIPETVCVVAQLSAVAVALGAALVRAVALASRPWTGGRPSYRVPLLVAGLPAAGFTFSFSPRPPPLA